MLSSQVAPSLSMAHKLQRQVVFLQGTDNTALEHHTPQHNPALVQEQHQMLMHLGQQEHCQRHSRHHQRRRCQCQWQDVHTEPGALHQLVWVPSFLVQGVCLRGPLHMLNKQGLNTLFIEVVMGSIAVSIVWVCVLTKVMAGRSAKGPPTLMLEFPLRPCAWSGISGGWIL
jgi:hypothetical protein